MNLKRRRSRKSLEYNHMVNFGGNRDKVLKRDNYRCVDCGMTIEEHKKEFGRDITIHHIDGRGRYSKKKNNSIDNLQTLCLTCHGKKDKQRKMKAVVATSDRGEKIVFASISDASKVTSACIPNIIDCLKGRMARVKNYYWFYA